MRKITLKNKEIAKVDNNDFAYLSRYKWRAAKNDTVLYAIRTVKGQRVYMHREILGLGPAEQDSRKGDHINGNGLDNRRSNLRIATTRQNGANRRRGRNNTSGYIGLIWQHRWGGWWEVYVKANGKRNYIGRYKNKKVAALARDKAAVGYFGEYAHLNFPKRRNEWLGTMK